MTTTRREHRVTRWLARSSPAVFATYAACVAFTTYFCMYSYRRPFAAAHYAGETVAGFDLKSALIIGQLCGYALSKMIGIKVNSELAPGKRAWALVLLIGSAELALVAFAFAPPAGKVVALFLNGIPLGTVWGICISFLEGRRTSEILGAGLSCAYVVASGVVKAVGAALLAAGISEAWMPAISGLLFLPLFLLSVRGLSLLPAPDASDVATRVKREPMSAVQRRAFIRRYLPGLACLVLVYLGLTSYRDFRDNFAAEIWADLGQDGRASSFALTEIPIAVSVMLVLGTLYLVKDMRRGLFFTYAIMIAGSVLIGISTLAFDAGMLGASTWMTLVGLGLYLGYVPYGSVLFDRTIASLGVVATAVFLIYVSDGVAYGGSVAIVIYKTVGQATTSRLTFFRYFSYATSILSTLGFTVAGAYFLRTSRQSGRVA